MSIRTWQEKDVPQVVSLLEELREALGENQRVEVARVASHYRNMETQPEAYENYVFEEDGLVVGFVSILFYWSVYHKNGTALVNELVVAKTQRQKGIGQALLDFAVQRARIRGMDEIEIGVMRDNSEAIRFYKSQGITEEYLLLGLELDGED